MTTTDLAADPRLAALLETTTRITGPGMAFEIVDEDVLGERLPVFANAPARSARCCSARPASATATATCSATASGSASTS